MTNNRIKKILIPSVAFLSALTFVVIVVFPREKEEAASFDAFAKCLTKKGAVMYGADWCPHCQNEKKAFGNSFQYVNYVECPKDPKRCLEAGIEGYPTWIFPDGKKLEGEQGLENLSRESGCPLLGGASEATTSESLQPQTNVEGGIEITVAPALSAESWNFAITLNTHSGDLSEDLSSATVLLDDQGQEWKPLAWEGDPLGGHHRSGTLKFKPTSLSPSTLTLIMKDVGGIKERKFVW